MKSIKCALIFLWKKILDLFYPKQCIICEKKDKDILCDECYKTLEVKEKIDRYDNKNFKEHLYVFNYEGKIRKLIIDYKFNDKAYIYGFFLKIILKNEKICRKLKNYDIIIPVPIHKKRKRERGYDQSELIARKLAESIDEIQLIKDVLIKQKNTVKQSSLTLEERKQNVKKVYKIQNKEKINNKRIVLFDDIYTTGSTANECARILIENGARQILVFTLAKD